MQFNHNEKASGIYEMSSSYGNMAAIRSMRGCNMRLHNCEINGTSMTAGAYGLVAHTYGCIDVRDGLQISGKFSTSAISAGVHSYIRIPSLVTYVNTPQATANISAYIHSSIYVQGGSFTGNFSGISYYLRTNSNLIYDTSITIPGSTGNKDASSNYIPAN